MGWFWSQQWIKKGTPISWYWHWDKHYSIVLGSFCSICIRHGQNIVGDCIYPYTTRGGRRCLALSVWKWTPFRRKKLCRASAFSPIRAVVELLHVLVWRAKHLPTISLVLCLGFCLLTFSQVLLGWPGVPQWSVDHLRTSHVNLTGNGNKASCL